MAHFAAAKNHDERSMNTTKRTGNLTVHHTQPFSAYSSLSVV